MKNKEFAKIWKEVMGRLGLDEFVVRGSLAFRRPVQRVLRGLDFDRSIDPRSFYLWVFVLPLYGPHAMIYFSLGWRLNSGKSWEADDPGVIDSVARAVQAEALPFLEKVQGPEDIPEAAVICRKTGDPVVQELVALSYARVGEAKKAVAALEKLIDHLRKEDLVKWQAEMLERAKKFRWLLLEDPEGAQRQLDLWEEQTVKALKLEPYWCKSCEHSGGGSGKAV